jgi:3-isopropylmalate dehydrogenase
MARNSEFRIAVMPGDGIGVEVMAACLEAMRAVERRVGGFRLSYQYLPGGAGHYRETGTALPDSSYRAGEAADAILFGAMGLPDVRYPDGTEIAPQLDLRFGLELYAGVRPIRAIPGLPGPLLDPRAKTIDLVILRESTEGLFASRGKGEIIEDREARDTMVITRAVSERLFDFAFRLAETRKKRGGKGLCTCVDKANVFRSMAFFRKIFDERAARHPDIRAAHHYIDAAALDLVRRPWDFDVMVTENQFGDILSDLGAAIIGGMGVAPSADIGDKHGLFQPCHGTAPDIAGKGIANPTAMLLSGAMMLDWLGIKHGIAACSQAAGMLDRAVEGVFASGRVKPYEFGGRDGTQEIARAVIAEIERATLE